jgi:hypothetical protein
MCGLLDDLNAALSDAQRLDRSARSWHYQPAKCRHKAMAKRTAKPSTDVVALLAEMLVDARGDDEQLTALVEGISEALDFPLDVHVVGEPLSLLAVDYRGNARRGLIARCRRQDGTEYGVSLADIERPPEAARMRRKNPMRGETTLEQYIRKLVGAAATKQGHQRSLGRRLPPFRGESGVQALLKDAEYTIGRRRDEETRYRQDGESK